MFLANEFDRIQRSLDGGTHCPLLDIGPRNLVAFAEFVDQPLRIGLGIKRDQEVIGAGHDVVDAGAAKLDQQRRSDTVACRQACEHQGFLDVVRVALPRSGAGSLLSSVVQHPAHLLGIQACSAPRGGSSAERAGDAVRAAVRFHLIRQAAERHCDPRANVVAQRNSAQHASAVDSKLLARGQRRGDGRATGMRLRRCVRIVGFIRVRQHPVEHSRFNGSAQEIRSHYSGCLFSRVSFRHCQRNLAGRQISARDHRRERVQDVMFGFLDYFYRERLAGRLRHIVA